jgi:hypothetical protein
MEEYNEIDKRLKRLERRTYIRISGPDNVLSWIVLVLGVIAVVQIIWGDAESLEPIKEIF